MADRGLLIGGLSSMSGKTLVSLGIMRALSEAGIGTAAAKAGPDYIDPGFHQAATGAPSVNLDPFAMNDTCLAALAHNVGGGILITEGVMGLHDGGAASSAHLAKRLGIPVVLVMDIRGMAETAAAIAGGINTSLDAMGAQFAGVILNRVRSPRHGTWAKDALEAAGIKVFGQVMESEGLMIPSRHLGLMQADEMDNAETTISAAAGLCASGIDMDSLMASAGTIAPAVSGNTQGAIPPPGERIAIARDAAFGFCYTHLLDWWRGAGAEINTFSPLADEAPDDNSDFIFLPGGYPELHLEKLTRARNFLEGIHRAAKKGTRIYGECGGYMVLGESITGQDGTAYPMTGLLDLKTDFSHPHRHLGYRHMQRIGDAPLPETLRGHEFHYTTALTETGAPLFEAADRDNNSLGSAGLVKGNVAGSYLHMIAAA